VSSTLLRYLIITYKRACRAVFEFQQAAYLLQTNAWHSLVLSNVAQKITPLFAKKMLSVLEYLIFFGILILLLSSYFLILLLLSVMYGLEWGLYNHCGSNSDFARLPSWGVYITYFWGFVSPRRAQAGGKIHALRPFYFQHINTFKRHGKISAVLTKLFLGVMAKMIDKS